VSSRAPSQSVTRAVIALGGNIGDRHATLDSALAGMSAHDHIELVAVSTFIETVAVHVDGPDEDAPRYLNAVALVDTSLDAFALHDVLRTLENDLGRERHERWGDRTLDLDLIDFGGSVIDTPDLTVPHPRAHERLFVLDPWLEIDPEATLPGIGSMVNARKVLS
jgi:2-amino-4-hydroxy-6-hydroxymethyldihydropteridine diphosphokinase